MRVRSSFQQSGRVKRYLKHMWPSGLRRQTQDLLGVTPHEFESRRVQIFYASRIYRFFTFHQF
jgi:hypothetical protein